MHAGRYWQQAGGTHPTGMHSCLLLCRCREGQASLSSPSDQVEIYKGPRCVIVTCLRDSLITKPKDKKFKKIHSFITAVECGSRCKFLQKEHSNGFWKTGNLANDEKYHRSDVKTTH